ncbi:MAG: amidohydrolase family protein [Lachnospiraceae bacterium]|nr:amidohydrolase family protein [Lachnospiraceae bacterium]
MVIDFHTHTFPEKIAARTIDALSRMGHVRAFTDGTPGQLHASMKKAGIDLAVLLPVATSPGQVEHINDFAAKINEKTKESGQLSFGCIHPDYENYHQELGRLKAEGFKGIKIHPPYQGIPLDDIRYLRILDRAAQLGLIVLTHAGEDIGFPGVYNCTPLMCRHVIEQIGPFSFVLAHMGGWNNWDEARQLLPGTGVYLDTSFATGVLHSTKDRYWDHQNARMLTKDEFMEMIGLFGADHILFGTDSPWDDQAKTLAYMRSLPLADKERDLILGKNAERLLGV